MELFLLLPLNLKICFKPRPNQNFFSIGSQGGTMTKNDLNINNFCCYSWITNERNLNKLLRLPPLHHTEKTRAKSLKVQGGNI